MIVAFLTYQWFQTSRQEDSQRWFMLSMGTRGYLGELLNKEPETNAGKAARFEYAWILYWDVGVKRLGIDGGQAMMAMEKSADLYRELAKDCAGDKVWEPEALYGLAVIEETHAVINADALVAAKKLYEDLAKSHPESARGQLAKEWVANYENADKKKELEQVYQELHTVLNIPDPELQKKLLDFQKAHDFKKLLQSKDKKTK